MTQYGFRSRVTGVKLPLLTGLGLVFLLTGCQQNARNLPSVNKSAAREALQTFLVAWKDGKKPDDLSNMIGKDSEWDQGATLEEFEILSEERTDGANLFLKVRRKVKTRRGDIQDQDVEYVVGTSPTVTVFRSDQ